MVRKVLDADKRTARFPDRPQQFVELGLHRRAVTILRILDQKDHEKGDDRGGRIDDQLPRIRIAENRAAKSPSDNQEHRHDEGQRSEEHTSEPQSLMRISYAVFCLKTKSTYTS